MCVKQSAVSSRSCDKSTVQQLIVLTVAWVAVANCCTPRDIIFTNNISIFAHFSQQYTKHQSTQRKVSSCARLARKQLVNDSDVQLQRLMIITVCHTDDSLMVGVPYQRCTNAIVQQRIEGFLYLPDHSSTIITYTYT